MPVGWLLATLFIEPLKLPPGARLWTFLPLSLAIAAVYRATRVRDVRELPWSTFVTFLNIVIGMVVIAGAAYGLHELVLRLY
jgi:uncharacterized membrane protein AbrB (regulator of aidB expression)